ncbi:MAG: PocR ligand-binding domain-containing protein [Clostridia bacterium]|nr:PocR ligand-binding domain-containing protein [Clostridia bacterium]
MEYNFTKIQSLLKDFYNLTGIKTCIYDNEENEICYYPEKFTPFCSMLRKDPQMDERCKNCDKKAFTICKKTRAQYVYTCHAGLIECVSPILYDNKIIGFVVLGQIKPQSDSRIATDSEYTSEELDAMYRKLPNISMEKINSAIKIIDACAGYEYLKNLLHSVENKIDVLLDRYISENLTADLSVQALCSVFHLSHSEIYSIFKDYFHSTPADHVKSRRLAYARTLLETTTLPVNVICKKCGLDDYNYFSKIFKRHFGLSPRELRKKPFREF